MFNEVLFNDEMAKSNEASEKATYFINKSQQAHAEADGYLNTAWKYIDLANKHNAIAKQMLIDAGIPIK